MSVGRERFESYTGRTLLWNLNHCYSVYVFVLRTRSNKVVTELLRSTSVYCVERLIGPATAGKLRTCKFHCFTVHFNSLNIIQQLMHFYMQ